MTSQPIRSGIAAAAAAGVLALAGCGSDEDKTATAETPAPAAETAAPAAETAAPAAGTATATPAPAAVPAALRGRWQHTVRQEDLGAIVLPLGTWTIDVGRKGTTDVYAPRKDSVDFTTQLTVDGRRLTFGPFPACTSPGSYAWRVAERRLILADADDTCSARAAAFVGTWTRGR
jgi:hypothetical protein